MIKKDAGIVRITRDRVWWVGVGFRPVISIAGGAGQGRSRVGVTAGVIYGIKNPASKTKKATRGYKWPGFWMALGSPYGVGE